MLTSKSASNNLDYPIMTTVPPAFILSRDLPEDPRWGGGGDNYELCVAIAKVVGRGELLGAQRIGALWRI